MVLEFALQAVTQTVNPTVETWPVGGLRPCEHNYRRHSPEQIQQIAAAIGRPPILVADDGIVLAGHGQPAAAIRLGIPLTDRRSPKAGSQHGLL
ncbi:MULTISPECIES: hypothetical protein [Bradyrhizobium]|uniref:hypothetical protein n=1 Tax=Bradyrhizobium TaxID=374 RepID=UPI00138AB4B9|nr:MULTISPECIES: hypothetical protein [Bradyrhizobium]